MEVVEILLLKERHLVLQQGRSPLHLASEKGHVEVVEFLLRHEAQLEAKDEDGNSALHLAVENKHLMVTQLLLESGTSPNIDNIVSESIIFKY